MKITIFLPTRKRPSFMIGTILSWLLNAKHPENIRVVILADDDDKETANTFHSWLPVIRNGKFCGAIEIIYDRPCGWNNVPDRINREISKTEDIAFAMTDDLICQHHEWDVRLEKELHDLEGVRGDYKNPAVIGLKCYNMDKALPDTWGWTNGYAEVFNVYSPWSSGDIFVRDLKNKTGMPHLDTDIKFYHGQRKKGHGVKDSTEEFGYSPIDPKKHRDKWIEEFGEERMKDEEWLKWYLARKKTPGDLENLVEKYRQWQRYK